jgi:hypothetical protein
MEINKKQTAVEWLFLMLNNPNSNQEIANKVFKKAKEMEKKDMLHFGAKCCIMTTQKNHWTLEKVYEETFKNK